MSLYNVQVRVIGLMGSTSANDDLEFAVWQNIPFGPGAKTLGPL
jgi:hypothetical protein